MTASNTHTLLDIHRRRLALLEQQHAAFGDLYTPAYLKLEIEDVRHEIARLEDAPQHAAAPLRMLVLLAAPLVQHTANGMQPVPTLHSQQELQAIFDACRRREQPLGLQIRVEYATTQTLLAAFDDGPFDLLHFSGHGDVGENGALLLLEDAADHGAARSIDAAMLRRLLGHAPCRLAFLSTCYSEPLAAALHELGVPHVVAISAADAVRDEAARVFAARLYAALLAGRSVKDAFERAVIAVESDDTLRRRRDAATLQSLSVSEPPKFRLLPADGLHDQPLFAQSPTGVVSFANLTWTGGNMSPSSDSPFVGRHADLHAVARALGESDCVIVTGFGGMGKTALAGELGRWLRDRGRYSDGVWYAALRAYKSVAEARVQIAADLQLPPGTEAENETLARALRDQQRLLILDDLDKLWRADRNALVALLNTLKQVGTLRLLLTGREDLSGRVQHTAVPLGRLDRNEAFEAFISYAPQASWGSWSQAAFDNLMRFLDGYPLAIRLAASYIKQPGCRLDEYWRRLQRNSEKYLAYANEKPRRDTALDATLDVSYDVLEEPERQMFATLALFPAGLTRLAARQIFGDDQVEALELLQSLSMAEYRPSDERFVLPEPARRYAERKQKPGTLDRHAPAALRFYAALVDEGNMLFVGGTREDGTEIKPDDMAGRALITNDLLNIEHFLDWGYTNEPAESNTSLSAHATARLGNYWTNIGTQGRDETLERTQHALDAAQWLGDRLGEANTLQAMGDVQQFRKEMDGALTSYQQALALFQAVGDRLGEANTRKAMGDVQQFRKEMDGALTSYQQALALFQAVGDRLGEANTLQAMGDVQQFRDDRDGALTSYGRALRLFQAVGSKLGEANTLRAMGDVQQFRADRDGALTSYRQALALFQAVGSKLGEANTLAAQSRLLIDSDPAQSQALLEQALALRQIIQDVYSEGADLGNYAIALLQRGRNDEALHYLQRARDLFAARGLAAQVEQTDRLIAQARGEE